MSDNSQSYLRGHLVGVIDCSDLDWAAARTLGCAHDLEAQARARLVRAALAARPMLDAWAGAGGVGKP